MTKTFKLTHDLTCPELAGYKLPEMPKSPDDDIRVDSYSTYNKHGEKYEFTESQLLGFFDWHKSKGYASILKGDMVEYIASIRTPRNPIAIEVEMDSTKSLLGVWTGFVPALNPDGTVKGRYIYE